MFVLIDSHNKLDDEGSEGPQRDGRQYAPDEQGFEQIPLNRGFQAAHIENGPSGTHIDNYHDGSGSSQNHRAGRDETPHNQAGPSRRQYRQQNGNSSDDDLPDPRHILGSGSNKRAAEAPADLKLLNMRMSKKAISTESW